MSVDSQLSPVRDPTPPGPCVMVVDDDAGVLGMLDESLRREGFSVRLAATRRSGFIADSVGASTSF